MQDNTLPVPDLWDFMLEVYAVPGVAPACLSLQESFGVDVPLLLSVLHAAGSGCRIDTGTVAALDTLCAQWRTEVVRPLRQVRVALKTHPWMDSDASVPPFRAAIKALELRAEKIETLALETAIAQVRAQTGAAARGPDALRRAAVLTAEFFAGEPLTPEPPAAREIAAAAWSLCRKWAV